MIKKLGLPYDEGKHREENKDLNIVATSIKKMFPHNSIGLFQINLIQ